jgi:ABC-type branched-subunit amino acid transport system ATPase component
LTLLELVDVDAGYGRTPVLRGINLAVAAGEVAAVIGRNGVGKTTLLKTVMRFTHVSRGTVSFAGRDVTRRKPHVVARAGAQFVPEDRGIFPELTVAENIRLGRLAGNDEDRNYTRIFDLFPILAERMEQLGGSLSGGERQMLALARALSSRARLLLLDEFSEGVQPRLVDRLVEVLRDISGSGVAVLLVEQNVRLALGLSTTTYVLEKGEIVDKGPSKELAEDEDRLRRHLVV